MLFRRLAGFGVVLLGAANAPARSPDRPTALPPLLTPPPADAGARPAGPPAARGPVAEYDHGHLYLPDYRPPPAGPPEARGLLARWRARHGWRPGLPR